MCPQLYSSRNSQIIISLLLLIFLPIYCAQDDKWYYDDCIKSFSCGKQKVEYPFWGGDQPHYCGLEGLNVWCEEDFLFINMGLQKFRVLDINRSTRAVTMQRMYIDRPPENDCLPLPSVGSGGLNRTNFDYDRRTEDIYLFYNCGPTRLNISLDHYSIPNSSMCGAGWFVNDTFLQVHGGDLKNCKNNVKFPVDREVFEEFSNNVTMEVQDLLKASFVVYYRINNERACFECEASGGVCWSGTNLTPPTCLRKPETITTIFTISLLALLLPRFHAQDHKQHYPNCDKTITCGEKIREIGYPFWGENRPSYCGLTVFNLSCENQKIPTISIGPYDQKFRVVDINLSEHTIKMEFRTDQMSVPVDKEVIEELMKNVMMQVQQLMNGTFVVHYRISETACSECEASGALCWSGTNLTQPTCVYRNGTVRPLYFKKGKKSANTGLKIGIGIGASLGSLVIVLVFFLIYRWRKKTKYGGGSVVSRIISSFPSSISDSERGGTHMGVPIFTYSELEKATNNFDSNKELGDGGFGTVYKGKLQDGRVVAVKRLYESNFKRVEQFMNEIEILTRLRHPNLVTLYGSTSPQCRQLLLVYEYIPNGTISDHLYGENAKPGSLAWKTRMSIAIDTASALAYLHALKVIHRDVKTNNILLDDNFRVKVADFGLSRLFPTNATHVSTAPQGTPGYVDPEYHQCYQLTDKSDVYSFGVVLIELISCKPAVDITRHRHEINLSNMAINKIQNGELNELVDPSLGFESDYEVRDMITEVAELAFQCLQNDREFRPCMEDVLKVLKRISSKYYDQKNQSEVDVLADDALLLKKFNPTPSPDSVTSKWPSKSTTSSSSS